MANISALNVINEGLPKINSTNSFSSMDVKGNSVDFLLDLIQSLDGYDELKKNIVDLFCLCHCGFLIKSNMSTWSNFAQIYSNLEHVEILEGNESIIKKYKKVFKIRNNII